MMYSQNAEERFIVDYFKDKTGSFLDIGGFDPFLFSNTRKLYEMGWSGVIVEPSPVCFKTFVKEYKDNDRIVLINKAVSDTDRPLVFYESNGDAVGTSDVKHMEKWKAGNNIKYTTIQVPAISMHALLSEHFRWVRFLSLDVEATNMNLFLLLPDWFLKQIEMICIEHDNMQDGILSRLRPFGYKEIYRNAENIICAK